MKTSKLLLIQAALKAPKDQRNNFGGYSYRSLEGILEAVKPLLYETQTTLTLSDNIVEVWWRIYVEATATLRDAETGEIIEQNVAYAREDESQKGMMASQLTGATSSYARKYCLCWLFSIDNWEWDPDSINTHWKETKATKKAEPKEENPDWWFKKACESKKFMQQCMNEDDFIKKIKDKYTVDEITEKQLRDAYKRQMWIDDWQVDLPFN